MVQLAQLDDTFFKCFVQLQNAFGTCLILRYTMDSPSRGVSERACRGVRRDSTFQHVATHRAALHEFSNLRAYAADFFTNRKWMTREKFCRTHTASTFALQHQNPQCFRAASDDDSILVRLQNLAGFPDALHRFSFPDFQKVRLRLSR
jgi:hypothetical protein